MLTEQREEEELEGLLEEEVAAGTDSLSIKVLWNVLIATNLDISNLNALKLEMLQIILSLLKMKRCC